MLVIGCFVVPTQGIASIMEILPRSEVRREPARSTAQINYTGLEARQSPRKGPERHGLRLRLRVVKADPAAGSISRSNHMAPSGKLPEQLPASPRSASRRSFVKGLGAAGVTLPALAMRPRWGFAEDVAAAYTKA